MGPRTYERRSPHDFWLLRQRKTMIDKNFILRVLKEVNFPGTDNNIVDFGVIRDCQVADNGHVILACEVMGKDESLAVETERAIRERLAGAGLSEVRIDMNFRKFGLSAQPAGGPGAPGAPAAGPTGPHGSSPDPWADRQSIPGVKHVIAVASGKGGVGKSTVAVNLALALREKGFAVGLMDADIYGPSEPVMLGTMGKAPTSVDGKNLDPVIAHGIKTISIGYLVEDGKPVIWRGPLVMKIVSQFLRDVQWGNLDFLVVDLPPGTGDVQLSLVQKVPLDGVVIVTTPQDVALADVRRGQAMFEKVEAPILGVIENMSYFCCPECGHQSEIFSRGGGKQMAKELNLELLAEIPLDIAVRKSMDNGLPIVIAEPDSAHTKIFNELATNLSEKLITVE